MAGNLSSRMWSMLPWQVNLHNSSATEDFDIPEPRDDIHYIIVHHDHGWQALDDNPPIDPDSGLPYNLVQTPLEYILKTSTASPDFNEQHSPFCGLISSMHTYGLYTGRYGLSNAISMDWIPQEMQAAVDAMLQHELNRQERLKKELCNSSLADERTILTAYKLLQFCDALALHLNLNPAGDRGDTSFTHVPQSPEEDVTISMKEINPGTYAFKPYPFLQDNIQVHCQGRNIDLKAQEKEISFPDVATEKQTMTLVAA